MTVVAVTKDLEARTMTIAAWFDAPIERVWELWSDPRQLERWWSPPEYPARVLEHDLRPGGTVTYVMTGAEGDQFRDWWKVRAVDPPHYLEFDNGFADDSGKPNADLPTTVTRDTLAQAAGGGTDIVLSGSATLVRWLLAEGLLDELRLLVHPVVVGKGARLFEDSSSQALKLVEHVAFSTGVLNLTYVPSGG